MQNPEEAIVVKQIIGRLLTATALVGVLTGCGSTTSETPTQIAPPTTEQLAPTQSAMATVEQPAPTQAASEPAATSSANAAPTAGSGTEPAAGRRIFQIDPTQSEASYAVQEQLLKQNLPNRAIGTTRTIEGQFEFTTADKPIGQVTKITIDLRTLKSDQDRRDSTLRKQWLESDTYPFAEFTSTEVQGAPESYTDGQEVTFKLIGDMKIHDTTHPVTFDVTGKIQGDTATGTATTTIKMSDFGVTPPNVAGVVSVEDDVTLTLVFTAKELT